jgi:peptidoglycan/LPS O-acetylase OafA/YrhL
MDTSYSVKDYIESITRVPPKDILIRRAVDYLVLALVAFLMIFILFYGKLSDQIDWSFGDDHFGSIFFKALIMFIVIYSMNMFLAKNWNEFSTSSAKYK